VNHITTRAENQGENIMPCGGKKKKGKKKKGK
jgi:hypothetical protein